MDRGSKEKGPGAKAGGHLPPAVLWACLSAVVLLVSLPGFPLDPGYAVSQYVHSSWDMEDGLPQNSVKALARTPDGFLWLGTEEGLVRFDGASFVVFDTSNTPALRSHSILSLHLDAKGTLWVGTLGGGVYSFRDGVFSELLPGTALSRVTAECLLVDREGDLWVGTEEDGLLRVRGGQLDSFTKAQGLPSDYVYHLRQDRSGKLWLRTYGGGSWRVDGAFQAIPASPKVLYAVHETERGMLCGAADGGLALWRDGAWSPFPREGTPVQALTVNLCHEDADGNLWLGAFGQGLYRLQGDRLEAFPEDSGLFQDKVLCFLEGPEGVLFIGTQNSGLHALHAGAFRCFGKGEGLADNVALTVLEDRRKDLWVGTLNGLSRFSGGRFVPYPQEASLAGAQVFSLAEDPRGRLWIGTWRSGLLLYDGQRVRPFTAPGYVQEETVFSLLADGEGAIWIGTARGLFRHLDGVTRRFSTGEGLPSDYVLSLGRDGAGTVLCGTRRGLCAFDGKSFSPLGGRDLAGQSVTSMVADREGGLWVGTSGGGLVLLRGGRVDRVTTRDGLFNNTVLDLFLDGSDTLWMSSNRGLFAAARAEVLARIDGGADPLRCTVYGKVDGLRNPECNGVGKPSGCLARDGRLWVPTMAGVVVTDTVRPRRNPLAPPVHIVGLTADSKPIPLDGVPELPPGTRNWEFQVAACTFLAPDRVRFRYRLEGYDRDWIDAGARRTIYYTGLPPGDYVFRVTATNGDGVWSESGAAQSFRLAPFFHQTAAFWILVVVLSVLALVGLGWWVHVFRMRGLKARAAVLAERNRIAREIHDTIAQRFSSIMLQMEAAKLDLGEGDHPVAKILEKTRALADGGYNEACHSIWTLRPDELRGGDFHRALGGAISPRAAEGVEVTLDIAGPPAALPEQTELNLLRIAQEAVNNAVRHARPRRVGVTLTYAPGTVRLSVRDDGCGLSATASGPAGSGFGLTSMRQRAEECGGTFSISEEGSGGTAVEVAIPLKSP